jgi:hypothetical protein
MRKYQSDAPEPLGGPRRSRAGLVVALALLLPLSPVIYEYGQVVAADWQEMAGRHARPRTPTLDALGEWYSSASRESRAFYARHLENGQMSPTLAVPLGVGWAVVMAAVFLRRVR